MNIKRTDDYALVCKIETLKKNKIHKKSWIQIEKFHSCTCKSLISNSTLSDKEKDNSTG